MFHVLIFFFSCFFPATLTTTKRSCYITNSSSSSSSSRRSAASALPPRPRISSSSSRSRWSPGGRFSPGLGTTSAWWAKMNCQKNWLVNLYTKTKIAIAIFERNLGHSGSSYWIALFGTKTLHLGQKLHAVHLVLSNKIKCLFIPPPQGQNGGGGGVDAHPPPSSNGVNFLLRDEDDVWYHKDKLYRVSRLNQRQIQGAGRRMRDGDDK